MTESLRVQSVLYRPSPTSLARYLRGLVQAVAVLHRRRPGWSVRLVLGDCSPEALGEPERTAMGALLEEQGCALSYTFFSENLGHGGGHNRLFAGELDDDRVLLLNPDTCASPNLLVELTAALEDDTVGIAEARQVPLEHQKFYDPERGDTSYASGACSMLCRQVIEKTGGFDAENFFLYCDDVDLSWRARLAGFRVVHRPSATVFHDKRLSTGARYVPGEGEKYHSGLAYLLMAWKYSRPDLVESWIGDYDRSTDPAYLAAATEFRRRRHHGELPTPLDAAGEVAQFHAHEFALHRFEYV